jgi:predicted enzyme related to lactoylglutathione lyase
MSARSKLAVVIYAKDAVRVSEFYGAVLEADALHREGQYVIVETPECHLVVLAIPARIAAGIEIASPPARRTETPIKVAFPVSSISRARAVAGELGGQIDSVEQQWRFGDDTVCDGQDPEGNVLQLRQR